MFTMKNKKAVSNIVSSIIIILLAITSISLIYLSINNFIKPSLSPATSCIEMQIQQPISINSACFYKDSNQTQITITAKQSNLDYNSIQFIFSNPSSQTYTCGPQCGNCQLLEKGTSKIYYFNTQQKNIAVKINNCLLDQKEITEC